MANINNSDAKITAARKSLGRSMSALAPYAKVVDEGKLVEKLNNLAGLLAENASTNDLEPIFKSECEVAAKVAKCKREKAEKALNRKFELANSQLARFAPKMGDEGRDLTDTLARASLAFSNLSTVENLQPLFALCDKVLAATNLKQDEMVLVAVDGALINWVTLRGGSAARYAVPFSRLPLTSRVEAWKQSKPAVNEKYLAFKAWRQAGWDLVKGDLKYPFGVCQCGKEPLLPYMDKKTNQWKTGRLGHNCYVVSQTSFKNLKSVLKVDPRTPDQIEADRVAARAQNEANRLAKKLRRQEASKKARQNYQEADDALQVSAGRDGASKKRRDAEKAERAQGGHPGAKGKGGKKAKGDEPKAEKKGKGKKVK